jgi:methylthioribulose-1-phosphate dehydratase
VSGSASSHRLDFGGQTATLGLPDNTVVPHLNDLAQQLASAGRRFDQRGWVLGTSGNFSAVVSHDPLRLAITPSGAWKGQLTADDILEVDATCVVVNERTGRPSAEAPLHVEIVRQRRAAAVLHTHSIWSTVLSDRHAADGGMSIEGFEMLKGLDGVDTHLHREWIPIIENDQDMTRLSEAVRQMLSSQPACHAFLLRRHGLYTWGKTLPEALRHVEIVEFLLEATGRAER